MFEDYSDWKTVEIEDCGTLKIPNNWELLEKDGFLYIVNENSKIVIVKIISDEDNPDINHSIIGKIKIIEDLSGKIGGNGVSYGKIRVLINGEECEKYYGAGFIFIDDTLDFKFVKKMTVSFSPY